MLLRRLPPKPFPGSLQLVQEAMERLQPRDSQEVNMGNLPGFTGVAEPQILKKYDLSQVETNFLKGLKQSK